MKRKNKTIKNKENINNGKRSFELDGRTLNVLSPATLVFYSSPRKIPPFVNYLLFSFYMSNKLKGLMPRHHTLHAVTWIQNTLILRHSYAATLSLLKFKYIIDMYVFICFLTLFT